MKTLSEGPGDEIPPPDVEAAAELLYDCLALVFRSLSGADRNRCSLVCKWWWIVDRQCRHHLSLNAKPELSPHIPAIFFSRFDSITDITLRCDPESPSINDEDLLSISLACPNLACLKLIGCRNISDIGIVSLARNCKKLTQLSCDSCAFGSKGLNSVFKQCCLLEVFSAKNLQLRQPIGFSMSLKDICLEEDLDDGHLLIGATNLRKLKLVSCHGDWDRVVESMANTNKRLVKIRLHSFPGVSDASLYAISNNPDLEILHLLLNPECTNLGILSIAERCKRLRDVHIYARRLGSPMRIGDEVLTALVRNCSIRLQRLALVGINPSIVSLELIASNCKNLESLVLGLSETIDDSQLSCLARKCRALKLLIICSCPISDVGISAFSWGFPNLESVILLKCEGVSLDALLRLKIQRQSLVIKLGSEEIQLVEQGSI